MGLMKQLLSHMVWYAVCPPIASRPSTYSCGVQTGPNPSMTTSDLASRTELLESLMTVHHYPSTLLCVSHQSSLIIHHLLAGHPVLPLSIQFSRRISHSPSPSPAAHRLPSCSSFSTPSDGVYRTFRFRTLRDPETLDTCVRFYGQPQLLLVMILSVQSMIMGATTEL